MRNKILLSIIALTATFFSANAEGAPDGKAIFTARCAACHNVNKTLTGPALAGIDSRRSIEWIINFVHSSQSLVQKGDTAAVAVFTKFNKIVMPDHKDLTEADIKNIVEYVKSETKAIPTAPFAKPVTMKPVYKPLEGVFYILCYSLVVIGLVGALYYAVRMKQYMLERKGMVDSAT